MSHSVPSDSSAIDATFLVGVDLVEFDRRELPIYASPQTRWMDACYDDAPSYGAPVDRVFGEPGDVHIDSVPGNDEQFAAWRRKSEFRNHPASPAVRRRSGRSAVPLRRYFPPSVIRHRQRLTAVCR
jgi:hypothetical protein